ncbi:maleylacetate reductase [Aureimonas sp. ME7]|uniref:maleylacetate reductase n=1 Tax=Aureimonas sp. ME7 TaxID=2744252 RepID=UPI0015F523BF|nr:maleylacetate reductase [Aureimonas sp. ME7]
MSGGVESFVYNANPGRVVFGAGVLAKLPEEVERLGLRRVLVVATPEQEADAQRIAGTLGDRAAAVFAGARMHTPVEVTERAMETVTAERIDGLVAVGGGSTTGLAKAVALRTDLPQIVAPTTYAGSEMTPILGETENGRKRTRSDPRILPEVVLYDVDLTLTLPVAMSVTSGINAIAHGVEALYARDANPIVSMMAERGIGAMARALPAIHARPDDRAARGEALFGAWLCGVCLGSVGMALHHKICHTLGGTYDLPHAETHTAVLPHALAFNAPFVPDAMAALRRALGTDDPARALFDLAQGLGATMALERLGLPAGAVDEIPGIVLANPYWNPAPLEAPELARLVANAFAGRGPA